MYCVNDSGALAILSMPWLRNTITISIDFISVTKILADLIAQRIRHKFVFTHEAEDHQYCKLSLFIFVLSLIFLTKTSAMKMQHLFSSISLSSFYCHISEKSIWIQRQLQSVQLFPLQELWLIPSKYSLTGTAQGQSIPLKELNDLCPYRDQKIKEFESVT